MDEQEEGLRRLHFNCRIQRVRRGRLRKGPEEEIIVIISGDLLILGPFKESWVQFKLLEIALSR